MRAFSSCAAQTTRCRLACPRTVAAHGTRSVHDSHADRRAILLSLAGTAICVADVLPAGATPAGYEIYYGADTPPSSYGGSSYVVRTKEASKYSFEYPEDWKVGVVNKTQKGTQGIDCIIQNPRVKGQRAFVITLARAGEDKVFRLTDYDSTFSSFSGADYDMQDAVQSGNLMSSERMVGDQLFYDYVIEGTDTTFRATITVNAGKVFALFIRCPSRTFSTFKDSADSMLYSFRTL